MRQGLPGSSAPRSGALPVKPSVMLGGSAPRSMGAEPGFGGSRSLPLCRLVSEPLRILRVEPGDVREDISVDFETAPVLAGCAAVFGKCRRNVEFQGRVHSDAATLPGTAGVRESAWTFAGRASISDAAPGSGWSGGSRRAAVGSGSTCKDRWCGAFLASRFGRGSACSRMNRLLSP